MCREGSKLQHESDGKVQVTTGMGRVWVKKPSLLSSENPDPLDQILASLGAKDVVQVCKDTLEMKLSFGGRYS